MSNKTEIFKHELAQIKNPNIREFTVRVLESLPDYFFVVAASSTGKYHSPVCLGDAGLIRHTKMNVCFAIDLMNLEMMRYTDDEKDISISSLLLHDGLKHGLEGNKYSVAEHPLIMADYIRNNDGLNSILDREILNKILECIETHMGEFNTNYKTKKEILPKPYTKLQNFVHMCDILGSRRYIKDFDFDILVNRK
jgi:hypothetical protein